ncbi:MAG: hypothetical protein WCO56_01980 [Verrucomicrobiota bacterium]
MDLENNTTSQLERLSQAFFTNQTKITFKNVGAVAICDLQVLMRLEAALDSTGALTNPVYEISEQMLANSLKPGQNLAHNFGSEPALQRLVAMPRERARSHVLCYVIRYRREIDKKPKIKLICFERVQLLPKSDAAFVRPTGIKGISHNPNGVNLPRVVKRAIWQFLEQLDIVTPLDD